MTSRVLYNSPDQTGALGIAYHYEMVSDDRRVLPFKHAIELVCPGKIVLESGTGTGILALLAARAGAEAVYAVEMDPLVAQLAKHNFSQSGYDNIRLVERDICDVTLPDLDYRRADVVVAENLSTWEVEEPELRIMNHINSTLASSDAIRLPTRITNYLELAESHYRFHNVLDVRTLYFQFTGIRAPKILSEIFLAERIDLSSSFAAAVELQVQVEVNTPGLLNSLRLTSPVEILPGISFDTSDSLMPPVIVPLEADLSVSKGELVSIEIKYEPGAGWNRFRCRAEKTG